MLPFCFRLDYGSETMEQVVQKLDDLFGAESSLDATSKVPRIIWKILGNDKVNYQNIPSKCLNSFIKDKGIKKFSLIKGYFGSIN